MSASNRDLAIAETLKWEGGYTNNPKDPGGPTNWGITIADAKRYWKAGATAADVKAMPKSVAIDIYAKKYWKTSYYDCDTLQPGVDLAVFDFGVNSGPARAKKYLDLSVGGDAKDTITKLCDKRLAFLKGLSTWPTFGKGWESRVTGIKTKSLQMASQKPLEPRTAGPAATAVVGSAGILASTWMWFHDHLFLVAGSLAGIVAIVGTVLAIKSYNKFKSTYHG